MARDKNQTKRRAIDVLNVGIALGWAWRCWASVRWCPSSVWARRDSGRASCAGSVRSCAVSAWRCASCTSSCAAPAATRGAGGGVATPARPRPSWRRPCRSSCRRRRPCNCSRRFGSPPPPSFRPPLPIQVRNRVQQKSVKQKLQRLVRGTHSSVAGTS